MRYERPSGSSEKYRNLEVPYFNKIKGIVENFSLVTGIDISLEFGNITSDLNKRGEEFVYRFLQEGLTNSFRHGRATSIRIILLQERDNLILSIEDNGVGSMDIVEGIGLNGMHERIVEQGGSIKYTSKAEGFTIIARLPLNKMQGDDYEQ
jgi:signal transduction histidine kinase